MTIFSTCALRWNRIAIVGIVENYSSWVSVLFNCWCICICIFIFYFVLVLLWLRIFIIAFCHCKKLEYNSCSFTWCYIVLFLFILRTWAAMVMPRLSKHFIQRMLHNRPLTWCLKYLNANILGNCNNIVWITFYSNLIVMQLFTFTLFIACACLKFNKFVMLVWRKIGIRDRSLWLRQCLRTCDKPIKYFRFMIRVLDARL